MKRPLAAVALAWACGLYAAVVWQVPAVSVFCLFPLAALLWRYGRGFLPYAQALGICLFFASIALVYAHARTGESTRDPLAQRVAEDPGQWIAMEGRVRSSDIVLQDRTRYVRFILDVDAIHENGAWKPLTGGVYVGWQEPTRPVIPGQRLRVEGQAYPDIASVNEGLWQIEDHLRAIGVHTTLYARNGDVEVVDSPAWAPVYWAGRMRQAEAENLQRAVPDTVLPFVLAVFLGDRGEIPGAERDAYLYSGTAHILAVSGLHMGIVFVSLQFVLQLVMRRGRRRTVCIMFAVFAFAFIAGARIPSVRAATMIALYLSADLVKREPDAPTALGISALLFLIAQPMLLFDSGFLMSYGSVASILLFAGPLEAAMKALPNLLRRPLSASLGVQLLPFPVMVHAFHVVPLLGPLANLVVVPLLGFVLWLCFFTAITGLFVPGVAVLFGYALWPAVALIRFVAHTVASTPLSHVVLTSPAWPAVISYFAAVLILWHLLRWRKHRPRWMAVLAACLLVTVFTWTPRHGTPLVAFLDVGHADSAFICTPGGTTLLIDGGMRSAYRDDGEYVVLPWLYGHQVRHLDYVVATHAEADHAGGLLRVLDRMSVGALVLSENRPQPGREAPLLDVCAKRGIPVLRVATGDELVAEGATVEVLHPPREWKGGEGMNNYSVVLRLLWPGLSVLFTGDVEEYAERVIAQRDCRAAVLKVPHHGSATSSSDAFLDAVNPRYAVISTAAKYEVPPVAPQVEARLKERGITVLRTDQLGGITLRATEDSLTIEGARIVRGYR